VKLVSSARVTKALDAGRRRERKSCTSSWFDICSPAIHDVGVTNPARTTALLVMAMLLAWQGIVLSIPHNHADSGVPQEQLLCSASNPSSEAVHLHAKGQQLSPHPCIACLAGSTVLDPFGAAEIEGVAANGETSIADAPDHRSRLRTSLPRLRGPPLTT
jgi:hypothetical protein